MNFDTVISLVGQMATIPFFPNDDVSKLAIAQTISNLTDDEEKVRWLVQRMRRLYTSWPGERELRACFCNRFKPLDGDEEFSAVYVGENAFPSELPQPELPQLVAGGISEDRQLEAAVIDLAKAKRMPDLDKPFPAPIPAPRIAETPQQKHFTPVTQADIDRAVQEWRAKKAEMEAAAVRSEVGL